MSEYQYYEFLAIDRPLTSKEMAALRAISTRAHITPVSFTNEYQWGDFKGNPRDLMRRFFDAHVYVANWGTAIFMVRLPNEALSGETARAMGVRDILELESTKTHWVITWSLGETEDYDRFGMEDDRGWMARLAPLRDELLRGDMRSLYIGWLAAVTMEMIDDDEMEPLSMEGLGNLTPAQKALAEFLEVDGDLLKGAGMGSPALREEKSSQKEIDDWIAGLAQNEVTALLKLLLAGNGQQAERNIKSRFAAWKRGFQGEKKQTTQRTVEEIRKNAEGAEKERLEQEKREKERREMKRRREREAYLTAMAKNFPEMWKTVRKTAERGTGQAYKEACGILVDLSEAYAVHASQAAFRQELSRFMADHMRRKAMIERLVKAGIWEGR